MTQPEGTWRKASTLAVAGAIGFWVADFAISLTPIAAEYRAALSISYVPMLLEALLAGLIIAFCVSYSLLRFFDKLPTKSPILKSVMLSFIALIIVTMLIEVPARLLTTSDPSRYFLIGAMIDSPAGKLRRLIRPSAQHLRAGLRRKCVVIERNCVLGRRGTSGRPS